MRIQTIFLLLFIFKICFSQDTLQILDSSEDQSLMSCEYFDCELVKLSSQILSCIETIVEPNIEESNVFWYLDFNIEKDSVVMTLSKQHIEQFMLYNKMHGIINKVLIVNDLVILVRDNNRFVAKLIRESKVSIPNSKSLDCIYFVDYPYWKFLLQEGGISLIKSSTFNQRRK